MALVWLCMLVLVCSVQGVKLPQEDSTGFKLLFSSMSKEVENVPLKFELSRPIPSWIKGTLVRNGPGKFEMGDKRVNHIFDGFAKLTSWRFPGDGSASFSTKMQNTDYYKDSVKTNTIAPYTLFGGTVPEENFFQKMQRVMGGMDNNPVNVKQTSKLSPDTKYVALNDMWKLFTFNISSLSLTDTMAPLLPEKDDLHDYLHDYSKPDVPNLSSAHPLFEYKKDNWVTYYTKMNPLRESVLNVIRMSNDMVPRLIASWKIDSSKIPYMHSFGVSQHYAIFLGNPCYFNLRKMVMSMTFDMKSAFECKPNDPMVISVVDLETGNVKTLTVNNVPGVMIHNINSYEPDKDTIIVDATRQHDLSMLTGLTLDNMLNVTRRNSMFYDGDLLRFTLHLDSGKVDVEGIPSTPQLQAAIQHIDFPVINENHRAKNYCYFWGTSFKADGKHFGNWVLGKKSVCNPKGDRIWHRDNHYPMEPWFLPRPQATREDDGILLTSILDGEKQQNYLAMFNATTLQMINYAYLPVHMPMDFHGRFFENV